MINRFRQLAGRNLFYFWLFIPSRWLLSWLADETTVAIPPKVAEATETLEASVYFTSKNHQVAMPIND
ncbi:MAG: hypothetical protein RBR97_15180 [Bacteroidales bacterium]|nr:hypothetical protein [Bacteroidales bacterium]